MVDGPDVIVAVEALQRLYPYTDEVTREGSTRLSVTDCTSMDTASSIMVFVVRAVHRSCARITDRSRPTVRLSPCRRSLQAAA